MTNATVNTYTLQTSTGRHIRKATEVIFEDGQSIRFTEKMSKAEAIRQAECQMSKRRR